MCSAPARPAPPPPPPPPPPPTDPEDGVIVSGSQGRKRALAGAAGRRGTVLTGGNLGAPNIGKTLLGS